jgi:hypothetical protein
LEAELLQARDSLEGTAGREKPRRVEIPGTVGSTDRERGVVEERERVAREQGATKEEPRRALAGGHEPQS